MVQNKFNKEQRSDLAKINHLLENRIDLADFEAKFGPLPAQLTKDQTSGDAKDSLAEEESESQSSSDEPEASFDKELPEAPAAPVLAKKMVEPDPNFFDLTFPQSRAPMPSFMNLGTSVQKPKHSSGNLFGRPLYQL